MTAWLCCYLGGEINSVERKWFRTCLKFGLFAGNNLVDVSLEVKNMNLVLLREFVTREEEIWDKRLYSWYPTLSGNGWWAPESAYQINFLAFCFILSFENSLWLYFQTHKGSLFWEESSPIWKAKNEKQTPFPQETPFEYICACGFSPQTTLV